MNKPLLISGALGSGDLSYWMNALHSVCPSRQVGLLTQAVLEGCDVAILDEHLEFEEETRLGSSIATDLLQRGFTGLLCIRSGNTSRSDRELCVV